MTIFTQPLAEKPLSEFLRDARLAIEEALDRLLPAVDPSSPVPPRLAQAMRYSVQAGGKRLRPVLVLMTAEACGLSDYNKAVPVACALELIHTYSLIHDDLPAMDNDDLRRGRPTCHRAFDEATAILAGDGLLTMAFQLIAAHAPCPEAAAQCVLAVAEGAGPAGMVGGQMADLLAETHPVDSASALEAIHRRKTGALLRASLRVGASLACAPAPILDALDHYGAALGLAFQIVDDLLDVEGDEAKLGKRVRKDSEHNKATYPALLGVPRSRQLARQLAEEAIHSLNPLGPSADRLRALVWELLDRDR